MTSIPTLYESTGLSVGISDPVIGTDRSTYPDANETLTRLNWSSRAVGGYYDALISFNDRKDRIEDWIQGGLGRDINIKNPAADTVWEGFVDRIVANLGGFTFEIGPLSAIANKVMQVYSTIDTTGARPVVGMRDATAWAQNLLSQAVHGIWEKVLSSGGITAIEAAQARDMYLAENAWPATSRRASNRGGGQSTSIDLHCRGYYAWVLAYTYNSGAAGASNLSDKLIAVRNADPNSIFSSSNIRITANTTQVRNQEDKNRSGWQVMKQETGKGDASFRRYTIGFYAGRVLTYAPAPTLIAYQQAIADNSPISNLVDQEVRPWDVNPAEWILFPDFLVGTSFPTTAAKLNEDPRTGFIEVVQFTAPYDLTVDGRKISQLDQQLARLGLAGLGA